MDKLEVGMYVRTQKGKIYKFDTDNSMAKNGAKKYMVNCSHNIIDLIEVGDYVNGVMVESMNNSIKPTPIPQYKNERGEYFNFDENDIESIVTKEQFSNMEYRIGD